VRYRYYLLETLYSGVLETVYFTEKHFAEAGLRYMSAGMPQIEAFMLINKWNKERPGKYWLGEGE
jgi:hypothetical protein